MKVHLLACLLLGVAGLQLGVAQKEYPNIAAVLKANDAKLYLEAARRARFDDQLSNGNTIATGFIPSDKAFNRFLKKVRLTPEQFYANNTLLVDVLMYHVVPGSARDVKQLSDKMVLTSMRGKPLTIAKSRLGDIIVMSGTNGKVIKQDMKAGAAMVHIVDDMLLPKDSLAMYALQQAEAIVFYDTLDDAIQAEDSITTFANMLDEAGLLKLVTSPGTSGTLFAPTNDALDAFWAAIEANGGNLTKVRNDKDMLADLCKQHITSSEVFRMAQLERMNNKDIEMSTKDNVGVIVRQEELPPPATAAIPALPTDPAAAAAMAAAAPPATPGSVTVLSPYAAQFSNDPTFGGMADPSMAGAAGMPAAGGLALPGAAGMPGAMQQPIMQQPGVMQQPGMAGVAAAPAVSVLPAATQQQPMYDPATQQQPMYDPSMAGFAAQPGLAQPAMVAPQVGALPAAQQQFPGVGLAQPAAALPAAPQLTDANQLMAGRRLRQAAAAAPAADATLAADAAEPAAPAAKPAAKAAAAKPAAAAAAADAQEPAAPAAKPAAKAAAKPAAAGGADEAAAPPPASNNTVTRVYLVDMFNITSMVQPSDRIGGAAVLHILDGVLMPPSIANYLDDIYNKTTGGRAAPRARRANRTATTAAEVGGNSTAGNGTTPEGSRRQRSSAGGQGLAAPLLMALLAGATTWAVLAL